ERNWAIKFESLADRGSNFEIGRVGNLRSEIRNQIATRGYATSAAAPPTRLAQRCFKTKGKAHAFPSGDRHTAMQTPRTRTQCTAQARPNSFRAYSGVMCGESEKGLGYRLHERSQPDRR